MHMFCMCTLVFPGFCMCMFHPCTWTHHIQHPCADALMQHICTVFPMLHMSNLHLFVLDFSCFACACYIHAFHLSAVYLPVHMRFNRFWLIFNLAKHTLNQPRERKVDSDKRCSVFTAANHLTFGIVPELPRCVTLISCFLCSSQA